MQERKSASGYYNGPSITSRKLTDVLPGVMGKIRSVYKVSPLSLLDVWPEIIGPSFAPFTKAVRFDEGDLYVQVKNSAVMSLLANPLEKKRIIGCYQERFGQIKICNIIFRIGKLD